MSKRSIFPQQHGERKKAKLNISISDHNFPLSQNKEIDDNWGDDNDDEILLLASQACEQAFSNHDISSLPDYTLCMQPASTSTQMHKEPAPSTSKAPFSFKKPTSLSSNTVSTNLKDKCTRIAPPLPGMLSKISKPNDHFIDDFSFNDKVLKAQDSEQIYRQMLQLQEENAKLKSENGKLQEKCVTKEGEASILRTQLKTCQTAVDNARMDKMKAQEKVVIEWTEKLTSANGQIHDLRNQLDFKNLEIISIKERCRMLESNKIKLTQVNVTNNDVNSSHRINSSVNDTSMTQKRKVKTCNNSVQTNMKAQFMEISTTWHPRPSKLTAILPLILENAIDHNFSLLVFNDKLQKHTEFSQNKCCVYSTFYRMPSVAAGSKEEHSKNISLNSVYENLTCIASKHGDKLNEKYFQIFECAKQVLSQTLTELEIISSRVSTAFQKEMDEKYINATSSFIEVDKQQLLSPRLIFKEEQAILARRIVAILVYIIDSSYSVSLLQSYEESQVESNTQNSGNINSIITGICKLLESTSCALYYSGLLLSIIYLIGRQIKFSKVANIITTLGIIKNIIISRPMPVVSCMVLKLLRKISMEKDFLTSLCPGSSVGNLKLDYDQGVLLYRKDSCYLQVLLKQIEACLKCVEKQGILKHAAKITCDLIALCSNINDEKWSILQDKTKCECRRVLLQVIVYALRICTGMLIQNKCSEKTLMPICRSGLFLLYRCCIDAEFTSTLAYNEGHFIEYCEVMKRFEHDEVYSNMLTELTSTFTSSPADEPSAAYTSAWFDSFDNFSIAD